MTADRIPMAVALVAVLLAGCGLFTSNLSPEELSQKTVRLLQSLPVEPLNGDNFDVTVSEVKLDDPYVSAHGVSSTIATERMVGEVTTQLQADGFEIYRSQPVSYGLGYEILASDQNVVVRLQLGAGERSSNVYPPVEAGSYVAIQMANTNSGPEWTDVSG